MEAALKNFFGYSYFRPHQKESIEQILRRRDCLIVMATGSGKSMCYQIPALVTQKTAIVISPLISLMQDQVMSLLQRGIKAQYLSSAQKSRTASSDAEKGKFDILYMTPERACSSSDRFWSNMMENGVSLLAIDEAHCISEWGHDFREEYKQLDKLRQFLPSVPFVALTATATKKVQLDIVRSLKLNNPYVMIGSFDRPNLYYGVKSLNRTSLFRDELAGEISKYVKGGASTIVYCTTVKDAEEVSKSLQQAGIDVGLYHGQMSTGAREDIHRSFIKDELQTVVATVAFGMGIDKPNIRCVIHYGCPKSLESYYQESGRCGRDGLPSKCWLYYSRGDFAKADFYTSDARTGARRKEVMDSLLAAQKYCGLTTCRRKCLLEYFGESVAFDNCGNCDNCTSVSADQRDMAKEAYLLLTCIQSCGGRWGFNVPIDVLRGSRTKKLTENHFDKLPVHGLGKTYSSNWWKALGDQLINLGYLEETVIDIFRTIRVSHQGQQFLQLASHKSQPPLILRLTPEMVSEENCKSGLKIGKVVDGDIGTFPTLQDQGFSEMEVKLYHMLLDFRAELAQRESTAPYAVCSEETLQKLAKIRPSTKARLGNIDGVNQHLITMHGVRILETIKSFSESLGLRLDGEFAVHTNISRASAMNIEYKATPAKIEYKATPAKMEAWKMWQENGLSMSEIANLPERPVPIKESTVLDYILEVARAGFEVNWVRFCKESGFTYNIAKEIQAGISKAGSRDKLKPIKEQVPEFVSYTYIKILLALEDCGVSIDEILGMQSSKGEDESSLNDSLPVLQDGAQSITEFVKKDDLLKASNSSEEDDFSMPPWIVSDTGATIRKRKTEAKDSFSLCESPTQKLCCENDRKSESDIELLQATEDALLTWLSECDGASVSQISEHFAGSSRDFVLELLSKLEGEFSIYNKNGIYKVM